MVTTNTLWQPSVGTTRPASLNLAELAFVAMLGFLGAVAFFAYRTEHLWLAVLVLGVPMGAACLFQPRVGVYAYGFWQAWDSAVKFGGSSTAPAWITVGKMLAIVVVLSGALHAWSSPVRVSAARAPFRWLLALCMVAAVSTLWSYAPLSSALFAGQMFLQLALAWVVVTLVASDCAHLKRLMFWTVLGAFSASAFVLLFGMNQRVYLRATLGEQANPVSVAAALVTGLSCTPVLWSLASSRLTKLMLIPPGLTILFAIFATGTRAAVAAIGAGFLVAGVFSKGRDIRSRLAVLAVSGFLVMGGTMIALGTGILSEQSESRLRNMLMLPTRGWDPNAGLPHARRSEIWLMSLDAYVRTNLIGTGLGATPIANEQLVGRYKDVHSSPVASLTELGPLGFLAFAALHVSLLLGICRLRRPGLQGAGLVVLIGFFLVGCAHTTYTTKWFWLPITFLLAMIELDARESSDRDALEGQPV